MTWHDKIRDMAVLHSLCDDLQLFWQLKAHRWEKIEQRLKQALEHAKEYSEEEGDSLEQKLVRTLKGDEDYIDIKLRLEEQIAQTLEIVTFLGVKDSKPLKQIHFDTPMLDNARIEAAVEDVENRLIPLCRVSSYPHHWLRQFFRHPKQFLKDAWEFYSS